MDRATFRRVTLTTAGVTVGLLAAPQVAGQSTYVLRDLESDGDARVYGINEVGQMVGWSQAGGTRHSSQWLNGTFSDLHGTVHFELAHPTIFDADYSEAYAISDAGQIVGTARDGINCVIPDQFSTIVTNAFVLSPAVLSDLGTPFPGDALDNLGTFADVCSAHNSAAIGVSNANHVVGWADENYDTIAAFLYMVGSGNMQNLGAFTAEANSSATAVNDSGVIVGYSYVNPALNGGAAAYHAFRIVPVANVFFTDDGLGGNSQMEDLGTLGGTNSWARGVNNAGQIVGEAATDDGDMHAFLWQSGVMVDLGTLGGENSSAAAINDDGDIVGWAETADGERRAVLWINGEIFDLNDQLLATTTTAQVLTEARAINSSGQIAGWGVAASGNSVTETGFLLRFATDDEIAEADAVIAAQNGVLTGDGNSSSDSSGATGTDGGIFGGVPLLTDAGNAANSNSTGGAVSVGDDTADGEVVPMMCGAGAVAFMPLTMLGLGLMRRRY